MKLRYKILTGVTGVLTLGVITLMGVTAYDSPCPSATPADNGGETMRALVSRCYGIENLRVERVAKPVPAEGEVLIRIRAAGVNPSDWHRISGMPYIMRLSVGIGAPQGTRTGYDLAGVVEAVGPGVTRFKPGDAVFGGAGGALAEFTLAHEDSSIALKPDNLSFEEAAAIPIAAVTALEGLRDNGGIASGQKVLINGASGGVGTFAVQIAKSFGAQVTGVCSTRNVELVRSLGADHVIDYTREDFTQGKEKYDLILDNVGNHSYYDLADVTTSGGTIVSVGGSKDNRWLGPLPRVIVSRGIAARLTNAKLPFFIATVDREDIEFLAGLANEGKLRTAIDRRYSLEEASAALDYIGSRRARGKVVVSFR